MFFFKKTKIQKKVFFFVIKWNLVNLSQKLALGLLKKNRMQNWFYFQFRFGVSVCIDIYYLAFISLQCHCHYAIPDESNKPKEKRKKRKDCTHMCAVVKSHVRTHSNIEVSCTTHTEHRTHTNTGKRHLCVIRTRRLWTHRPTHMHTQNQVYVKFVYICCMSICLSVCLSVTESSMCMSWSTVCSSYAFRTHTHTLSVRENYLYIFFSRLRSVCSKCLLLLWACFLFYCD